MIKFVDIASSQRHTQHTRRSHRTAAALGGKVKAFVIGSLTALLAASSLVNGAVISTPLGNTSPGFADGSHPFTATVLTNLTGPAPFNAICGSDTGTNGSTNCSTSWTFHYS